MISYPPMHLPVRSSLPNYKPCLHFILQIFLNPLSKKVKYQHIKKFGKYIIKILGMLHGMDSKQHSVSLFSSDRNVLTTELDTMKFLDLFFPNLKSSAFRQNSGAAYLLLQEWLL